MATDTTATRIVTRMQVELLPALHNARQAIGDLDPQGHIPEVRHLLRVIEDITPQLETFNARAARELWKRIVMKGSHLIWTGAGREGPDGLPICNWKGKRTTVARVMWELETGQRIPEGERMHKKPECEHPRCVAPGCYRIGDAFPGRVSSVRRDASGNPVCKNGHRLKREPRPRETVYCGQCRQEKLHAERLKALDLATEANMPVIKPGGDRYVLTRSLMEREEAARRDELGMPPDAISKVPTPKVPTLTPEQEAELAALFDTPLDPPV